MAEDKTNDSKQESSKQGNPWLVLSLVLLIVPVVTLAMTEFIVIPRLKHSMGQPNENQSPAAGRSKGERAPSEANVSHRFDEIVANLAGTMGTRFIRVSFEVRGRDPALTEKMRTKRAAVYDAINTTLSSESIQSLETPGGRNRLRVSLIGAINQSLSMDLVEELYFTEFIIQ